MNTRRKRIDPLQLLAALFAIAVVAPAPTVLAQSPDDDEMLERYAQQQLRVGVWLDKGNDEVYRRGEALQVTFQTNEDAYAVLYHIDVEGRVAILWPTSRYNDGFVFGGHQYRLPASDGNRLRVGEPEGLGYVQAVVSRYPFDLRDLPLDFHHEDARQRYDYYVAGDPFLAMNEVNFAVTGLEDASEFVITNHVSYYVHRQVDHPRYLCSQCHDDGIAYEPYQNTCTVTIRYDHSWQNTWWGSYGFYPVYHYPVYFYVDPWTGYRWVNYWYDPWYYWPPRSVYNWGFYCYDWRYSPYWRWDSYVAYERGNRRHTPLTRVESARDRSAVTARTKNALVTERRPDDDRLRSMKERTVADAGRVGDGRSRDDRRAPAGGAQANVRPVERPQDRVTDGSREQRTAPGLRVPQAREDRSDRGDRGQAPVRDDNRRDGENRRQADAVRPPDRAGDRVNDRDRGRDSDRVNDRDGDRAGDRGDRQQVRPGEPRHDGSRVWTNRRNQSSSDPRPSVPNAPVSRPPTRQESGSGNTPVIRRGDDGSRNEGSPPAGTRGSNVQRPQRPSSPPAAPPRVSSPPRQESPRPATPPPAVSPRSDGGRDRGGNQGSSGGRSGGGQSGGGQSSSESGRTGGGRR